MESPISGLASGNALGEISKKMAEKMSLEEKERRCQEIADKTGEIMYLDEGGIRMAFFPTNKEIEAIHEECSKELEELHELARQGKIGLREMGERSLQIIKQEDEKIRMVHSRRMAERAK